jgi:hypothetical protein
LFVLVCNLDNFLDDKPLISSEKLEFLERFCIILTNWLGIESETGQVHSFEPVPAYFKYLQTTWEMNQEFKIVANNFALGEKTCECQITTSAAKIGGHSIKPGFVAEKSKH